jgi:hypothetical protein
MAYRFDGVDDYVRFDIAPLNGYTIGPVTIAAFFKRRTVGATAGRDRIIRITPAAGTPLLSLLEVNDVNGLSLIVGSNQSSALSGVLNSTSVWYLAVATWVGTASSVARLHVHDGSSWTHANSAVTISPGAAISGTGILTVAQLVGDVWSFDGDIVCAGIKKADSTDMQVETLSPTAWSAWTGFGFDWLIGFDSSLESAGVLQDQGTAGTGDETAILGTSAVSDPPGWAWTGGGASTFVPQISIIT